MNAIGLNRTFFYLEDPRERILTVDYRRKVSMPPIEENDLVNHDLHM